MHYIQVPTHFRSLGFALGMCFLITHSTTHGQSRAETIRDKDGHIYPVKTMSNNHVWMTTNLKTVLPESYCYENNPQHCTDFGRLYTWAAAQEGCQLLGDGWRLPSLEEWEQLAKPYGGSFNDSKDSGRSAFQALLAGGRSGFNAVLGGGRDVNEDRYGRINGHGFYWTATASDSALAWFANFGKGSRKLFIQKDGEHGWGIAVRCIKGKGTGN